MIKKLLLLTLFISIKFLGMSQDEINYGNISGEILNNNKEPAIFLNILLKKSTDSSIVKLATTDTLGRYEFSRAPFNTYFIEVSSIEYETKKTEPFILNKQSLTIKTLEMKSKDVALGEIVVSDKHAIVEHKIDKTVVNVSTAMASVGESAMEVIEKLPGVYVNNGRISLKGKEGIEVLIDGRSLYMNESELANYLKNVTADQLSQIEIMDNPPAKYEASGKGVINIVTKKNKYNGKNGSYTASYRQGEFAVINQSFNFNYRNNRITFFGNINYLNTNDFEKYLIIRNFRDENSSDIQTIYDQNTYMKNSSHNLSSKIGFDYEIDKKTSIGIGASGFYNPGDINTENTTLLKESDESLRTKVASPSFQDFEWRNLNLNLNFLHKIDTLGKEFSADFNYVNYGSQNNQDIDNFYYNGSNEVIQEPVYTVNNLDQRIDIYAAKTDYVHPFSKKTKMEIGAKYSYIETDNDAKYFFKENNELINRDELSNKFVYNEKNYAAYANFSKYIGKWGFQAGIRYEQEDIKGNQVITDETFNRSSNRFFPTAYISYSLNENDKFGLNYGSRIERPEYSSMNPFRQYLDSYTYMEGNPYLQPQLSHNIELEHVIMDGLLKTSVSYSTTTDIIIDAISQNSATNETFTRPENLNKRQDIRVGVDAMAPLSEQFTINLYAAFNNTNYEGELNNGAFSLSVNTFDITLLNHIRIKNNWTIYLLGKYVSESIYGTFVQEPYGNVSLSVGKKIMKDKGQLRLSFRDIFYNEKFIAKSIYQNIDISVDNSWQSQTVLLEFTYRFGSALKSKAKIRESNAVEKEIERIKIKESKGN